MGWLFTFACSILFLLRFWIYGGLCHAPLVYNWLKLAARLFPKDTVSHLAAKVFMDQTCFAPVGLSMFYVGLSILEGKDKDGVYMEWREKFPNTWAVSFYFNPSKPVMTVPIFRSVFLFGHFFKQLTSNTSPHGSGQFMWGFSVFSGQQG